MVSQRQSRSLLLSSLIAVSVSSFTPAGAAVNRFVGSIPADEKIVPVTSGNKIFGLLRDATRWIFGNDSRPPAPSDRRRGGAARDECPNSVRPLTAIVPSGNLDLAREHTTTLAAQPTFWFYVPFSPEFQQSVEFVLIDENEQDVYKQTFQLTGTPGIVSIRIPDDRTLATDVLYRWVFSVACNPENRSGDVAVDGWIKRVVLSDDVAKQLQQATTPAQQLEIYAEERLWHETLNTLIEWRRNSPQDGNANQAWMDLLTPIGLESLVDQPLTPCCTLTPSR